MLVPDSLFKHLFMDLLIDTNRLLTRVLEWRQPAIRVGRPSILICLQEHADRLVIFVLAACMLWWWVDKRTYTRPEGETGKSRTGDIYLKLWQLWLEYTRDVVYKEFGCRPWHETYDEVGWTTNVNCDGRPRVMSRQLIENFGRNPLVSGVCKYCLQMACDTLGGELTWPLSWGANSRW